MEPDGRSAGPCADGTECAAAGAVTLYSEDGVRLEDAGGTLLLSDGGERRCRLSSHPYGPLYIDRPDGTRVTVHMAFSADELRRAARGERIRMVTGHEYGAGGLCRLLLFAAGLGLVQTDIGYIEGRVFIRTLEEQGALSPGTAVDLAPFGLVNRNIMNRFIHAGRVRVTGDGKYYIGKRYGEQHGIQNEKIS